MAQPKYWDTPEFKKLSTDWDKKLEIEGFVDIEKNAKLKRENDGSSNSFKTKEQTSAFFQQLDEYLRTANLSPRDYTILNLYSEGRRIGEIAQLAGCAYRTVHHVIKIHKTHIFAEKT